MVQAPASAGRPLTAQATPPPRLQEPVAQPGGRAPTTGSPPRPELYQEAGDVPSAQAARPTMSGAQRTGSPAQSGPRRVNLTLGHLDPWSVMKLGFLVSVAIGIALVIMVAVLWLILDAMGVFTDIDRTIGTVLGTSSGAEFDIMDYAGFGRVLSLATVIAVVDVFLLTALSTLGALLYNISSSLVGGVQVTLTDD
ncbi:MAG: DUF3566 domain-containing protein [Angustibacter sp.]